LSQALFGGRGDIRFAGIRPRRGMVFGMATVKIAVTLEK
jgi:hypothetical protein